LRAQNVGLEPEGRTVVVERVDADRDRVVGVEVAVAFEHAGDDLVGLAVEGTDAEVQEVVVVGDADLGALGNRLADGRLELPQVGDGVDVVPERLVEAAVDLGGNVHPEGPNHRFGAGELCRRGRKRYPAEGDQHREKRQRPTARNSEVRSPGQSAHTTPNVRLTRRAARPAGRCARPAGPAGNKQSPRRRRGAPPPSHR